MTHEIQLRTDAEQDVADAARWYEQQLPGLGHQFLDEIQYTLSGISESPLMYPVVYRNTRRALIHRFPFGIYFRVEQTSVVVIAILHGSRHPRRWKSRL